ncbi:hypothetical protein FRB97_004679, partial [Tulasnella sp. 331]
MFLGPTPFHALERAADEGPVLIVNISEIKSDSIILHTSTEPEIVNLLEITPTGLAEVYLWLREALGEFGPTQHHYGVKKVLCVWESTAQPIVEKLQKMGVPPGSQIW